MAVVNLSYLILTGLLNPFGVSVAAAAGIAMVLAFWCLVWPVAGAQAGPLAALVVGTAVAYAVVGLGMIFLIALGLTMIPGKP